MTSNLVVEFSIAGGRPPASYEYLKIDPDGGTFCMIGNAWPEGRPQDEAGLYRTKLPAGDLEEINAFLHQRQFIEMAEDFGPRHPDSGFNFLRLRSSGQEKTITWSPFASVPDALEELRAKMRQIIDLARHHPEQVVSASLIMEPEQVKAGQPLNLILQFHNPGSHPVRIILQSSQLTTPLRVHAATAGQVAETKSVVSFYRRARPVQLAGGESGMTVELLPGQELRVHPETPFALGKSGSYQIFGFAEPQIELAMQDEPLLLPCFLTVQPVAVLVEPADKGDRA
jgi:hypothetical protein